MALLLGLPFLLQGSWITMPEKKKIPGWVVVDSLPERRKRRKDHPSLSLEWSLENYLYLHDAYSYGEGRTRRGRMGRRRQCLPGLGRWRRRGLTSL